MVLMTGEITKISSLLKQKISQNIEIDNHSFIFKTTY